MQRPLLLTGAAALGTLVALSIAAAPAPAGGVPAAGATYEVSVTNLTRAQIFSPLLAATHSAATGLFQVGTAASPELALLAEDGDNSMLASLLATDAAVLDIATGGGMLFPGQTETLTLTADAAAPFLSLAGMLVSSNDAFVGLDSLPLPMRGATLTAVAYDAGSEFNSEDCAFVPGPPCGSGGAHDPTPAEGFVYVSNGIQGVGNVPAEYDWRNPVAQIVIRRKS